MRATWDGRLGWGLLIPGVLCFIGGLALLAIGYFGMLEAARLGATAGSDAVQIGMMMIASGAVGLLAGVGLTFLGGLLLGRPRRGAAEAEVRDVPTVAAGH